jgi:hypothetical protein
VYFLRKIKKADTERGGDREELRDGVEKDFYKGKNAPF